MLFDRPQVIYLISPQAWDGIKVSKHHYATELCALGHRVFFIEPPRQSGRMGAVRVQETEVDGLSTVSYTTWFPYRLKFHVRWLFDLCMARQAGLLVRSIGVPADIVWDFDNAYQFSDLRVFGGAYKIFHAVDNVAIEGSGDKNADVVLSVAQNFLERIAPKCDPVRVIPHGLGRQHAGFARSLLESQVIASRDSVRPCVGYVGNLDMEWIDWPVILRMINENEDVDFLFIGPYGDDPPRGSPLFDVLSKRNCRFIGRQSADDILKLAVGVDIWLLCYDVANMINGSANSHKILEYLATGKAVLSCRLDPYVGSGLVVMPDGVSNETMPELLSGMIADLGEINNPQLCRKRAEFALRFSYATHLREIDELLQAVRPGAI